MSGLAIAARLGIEGLIPFPRCWWREFTGLPCPTCGFARCLAAWTSLELSAAFRLNPLLSALILLWLGWAAHHLIRDLSRRLRPGRAPGGTRHRVRTSLPGWRLTGRAAWVWTAVLVAANWVYLCLTLPR